jgi:chorismate mutase
VDQEGSGVAQEDRATACRGIRGAITVDGDGRAGMPAAVEELLEGIVDANGCLAEDVAAAIFTVTDDLPGTNPAAAARAWGWDSVPLLTVAEYPGDTGVPRCVRVLVLWNTSRPQAAVRHVYLKGASALRPDLAAPSGAPGPATTAQ